MISKTSAAGSNAKAQCKGHPTCDVINLSNDTSYLVSKILGSLKGHVFLYIWNIIE